MQINQHNNVTFKTKIKVVTPKTFSRIVRKMDKGAECEKIDNWTINPIADLKGLKGYRTNMNYGYTRQVCSCTSGIAVKKGIRAPLFWHIENNEDNIQNIKTIEEKAEGDNAILIGSKSEPEYSDELYNCFQNIFKAKRIPTTILKTMGAWMETDVAYSSKYNTLYLSVKDSLNPYDYVRSMKDLKKAFKVISVSLNDTIKFLNPIKGYLLSLIVKF